MAGYSKRTISRITVNNATNANTAQRADFAIAATSASYSLTASYALTSAGTVTNATSASYAATASLLLGSVVSASYALTASYAMNGGGGTTTGSFTGSFTGSLLGTASYALTSSYAISAENAKAIDIYSFGSPVDSYLLMSNVIATSGVAVGGDTDLRYNASTNVLTVGNISATTLTGSLQGTSSWAINAITASYVLNAVSSSFASTASLAPNYVLNSATSSFITNSQTSSMTVLSSSFASTSSFVNTLNQNVNITGNVSASGNITAQSNLISAFSSGDEGGEILLAKSATNNSLTGSGITIDSYQNRIRIFEQAGNNRGGYFDIASMSTGVGTNLQKSNIWFYDAYLINAQTTAAGTDTTINNISLATRASEAWSFEFYSVGQCSGTGGVRFTVVYSATPVSSSVSYWGNSTQVGNMTSATTVLTTPAQSNTMWATATPIDVQAHIRTSFVNGANANTVTIKIQPQNGAQTATLRAMTYMTARRIA